MKRYMRKRRWIILNKPYFYEGFSLLGQISNIFVAKRYYLSYPSLGKEWRHRSWRRGPATAGLAEQLRHFAARCAQTVPTAYRPGDRLPTQSATDQGMG
jgi:hypothetical protein